MNRTAAESAGEDPLDIALSPHGRLIVQSSEARKRSAIAQDFQLGNGIGLLHLSGRGVPHGGTPGVEFFARFGERFFSYHCTLLEGSEIQEECPAEIMVDFLSGVPPILGAEYCTEEFLRSLWTDMASALRAELPGTSFRELLRQRYPRWAQVGRLCFHLAENKRDEHRPFAFLATYTAGVSANGKAQHVPLSKAFGSYAQSTNRKSLLSVLLPLQHAAAKSSLLRELFDSKAIFQAVPWDAKVTTSFLRDVPIFEESGIVVRMPAWGVRDNPLRPTVQAKIGKSTATGVGLDALLDFSLEVSLGDQTLTVAVAELRQLLKSGDGLVRLKGQWVEINGKEIEGVLDRFLAIESLAAREGLSFRDGMRLLSQASIAADEEALQSVERWAKVTPGEWLKQVLVTLRSAPAAKPQDIPGLRATLRPYQECGVEWLNFLYSLRLGGCLADDMGLGKTVQVIALLLKVRPLNEGPSLLVVPASVLPNWKNELARFAPSLKLFIAHTSENSRDVLGKLTPRRLGSYDVVITSYASVERISGLRETDWNLVILDEAQAIKNPTAKQTRTVKALRSRRRLALTGTPIENSTADLWSLFDFLNPGLLGSAPDFDRFVRSLLKQENVSFTPLRNLVQPYILRRLKTDRSVISDLPEKTENIAYCTLTKE